ncbi:ankyrin repeat protein [Penicillium canescens]|nr:ankyrin repeat protein [Penicillium canescens]
MNSTFSQHPPLRAHDQHTQQTTTTLIWAARNGNSATVERFFKTVGRKEPNDFDDAFDDAFFQALQHGHEGVVEILLENSDIDVNRLDTGETPIYTAAAFGHTALVKMLLNIEKVDIEANHFLHGTPLCVAAKFGYVEVVKLLLATGRVNTEATNISGETPLYSAAENGKEEMVELFLERGLDLGAEYCEGETLGQALVDIARKRGHEGVMKLVQGA